MDEREIDHEVSTARRHDRWSVLIVGLNAASRVATVTANMLGDYTIMAVQHANQVIYDRKFKQITDNLSQWEQQ